MNISLALLLLAQNEVVPLTGWIPPDDNDFQIAQYPGFEAFPEPYQTADDFRTPLQVQRLQDMACVVWARTSSAAHDFRCRSSATLSTSPFTTNLIELPPGSGILERQGWKNDGVDEVIWLDSVTNNFLGNAWCATPFLSGGECDYWLNIDDGFRWLSFLGTQSPSGAFGQSGQAIPGFQRAGFPITQDIYGTMLHETGHTLGLFHADDLNTSASQDCPSATYDCPIMSGGGASAAVSYWPQFDEIQAFQDRLNGTAARRIQWATFRLVNNQIVTVRDWTDFPETTVRASHIARVSCRSAIADFPQCVLSAHRAGVPPTIHPLVIDTETGNVQAAVALKHTNPHNAELGVDIAYGRVGKTAKDRFVAVGKRRVDAGTATQIVVYTGEVNNAVEVASAIIPLTTSGGAFTTHTEPRISFHEPASVWAMAWPDTAGLVRIATFTSGGTIIDQRAMTWPDGTNVQTYWPVEIACDSHLWGSVNNCKVFVLPYGTTPAMAAFRAHTFTVGMNANGTWQNIVFGSVQAPFTTSQNAALLLADVPTYGTMCPICVGDVGNRFLVTQDRLREFGTNTVAIFVDTDGNLNPPDILVTNHPSGTGVNARQSNMMSWDAEESTGLIVAVRTGQIGGIQ